MSIPPLKKIPLQTHRVSLPVYHKNRGISIDFYIFYTNLKKVFSGNAKSKML